MTEDRRKVVWFEGMTLDPHHFQQWDQYQQQSLNGRLRALSPYDYGFQRVSVDRERLANGEFSLTAATGVMPDGLQFDIPSIEEQPIPRNVQDFFPATKERIEVFLAIPVERQDGSNYTLPGAPSRRQTRYGTRTVVVQDENTGVNEREIEIAKPNFLIRFEEEGLEAYSTMKIAVVTRNVGGTLVLDDRFVPTCLTVAASDHLKAINRRLLELLVAKSGPLLDRQRDIAAQRELSPNDIMTMGLLSTLNTYIPLLNHHFSHAGSHPEALYISMLGLAGQLSAYIPEASVHPREFPRYDHTNLTACFERLEQVLLSMLGEAKPRSNYIKIPLELLRENLYTAQVEAGLLEAAQFFLVARSENHSEGELTSAIPTQLRVAAPANIDAVLRAYTRALRLEHTHRLPTGLPVDQRASYFELLKRGPFWESISREERMAVFVPAELQAVDIQLVAVNT
ncbi:MAG: type VI secretion system baseplate subunit TssK [Bacteroidota bacterium]